MCSYERSAQMAAAATKATKLVIPAADDEVDGDDGDGVAAVPAETQNERSSWVRNPPATFFFLSPFSVFLRFFIVYGLFWNSFCTHTEKNVRLACHESLKPLSRYVKQ